MNQTMENGRTEQIIEQLTDQIENGKSFHLERFLLIKQR